GKRLIKSPKVYLGDSGLACYLLGIATQAELDRSPFLGPLFEGYVAAEILKSQVNQGRRKELYHFRDQQGLEVDFLFPSGRGGLWMVECKATKTVHPSMAGPLGSLRRAIGDRGDRAPVRLSVVHCTSTTAPPTRALAPGVGALDVRAFVDDLNRGSGRPPKAAVRRSRKAKCETPSGRRTYRALRWLPGSPAPRCWWRAPSRLRWASPRPGLSTARPPRAECARRSRLSSRRPRSSSESTGIPRAFPDARTGRPCPPCRSLCHARSRRAARCAGGNTGPTPSSIRRGRSTCSTRTPPRRRP